MRCRGCGAKFNLFETIHIGIPPGAPARPGESLILFPLLALLAVAASWLWDVNFTPVLGLFLGTGLLAWLWHYCMYWHLDRHPYDRSRPGTCPECKYPNFVWPWSM